MALTDRIVITGASGFLGRALIDVLYGDERFTVFALTSRPESIARYNRNNVSVLSSDAFLKEEQLLENATVIHCAYPRNVSGASAAEGLAYVRDVVAASCRQKAAALINISSQSVYASNRTEIADEQTPVCLESTYGVGKYAVELFTESFCEAFSVKHTSIRLASLIGPAFEQRIVNRLVADILAQNDITITDSKRSFGFLDVLDAVGYLTALVSQRNQPWERVYTLGDGKAYTVKEIYETIEAVLEAYRIKPGKVEFRQMEENHTSAVSGEKLSSLTGYRCQYSLRQTVERIVRNALESSKEKEHE